MNPHKKTSLILYFSTIIIIFSATLLGIHYLNFVHKKNMTKLQKTKPLCQQYTLKQSDPVWFYKPDEIGWTKGEVVYLWGYHPVVHCEQLNKTFNFHKIEWIIGND